MIEITPNWHPVFVHFTVGILFLSVILYIVGRALRNATLLAVAKWNLWLGVLISLGTVTAGWLAMRDVSPVPEPIQGNIFEHMLWALATAAVFGLMAAWALVKQRYRNEVSWLFVGLMVIAAGMLGMAGYKGGKLVFHHGVGVTAVNLGDEGFPRQAGAYREPARRQVQAE